MTMLLKHLLLTITLATTALLTVPTGGFAQSTASSNPDDAAIRKTLDGLGNAADTRNLAAFASFFVQSICITRSRPPIIKCCWRGASTT